MKPARYIGGEINMPRGVPDDGDLRVCLAFPDVYDIGQSYIGFHILYHILTHRPNILCERAFAPWPDMEAVIRENHIPLWSLENFLPVAAFDVVGFTLQYELHYTTVLNMLDLAGIPLRADDRNGSHPLIIGGGTCCANPEPVAPFFDAFLLGDGEEGFPEMLDVIGKAKSSGASRTDTLSALAGVEGVYVPSLYLPVVTVDGTFGGMTPVNGKVPIPVRSRIVEELKPEYYPDKPLVPLCEVVHDRLAVEIMRGCVRGCRFCGAGMTYRPLRLRPVSEVVGQIVNGINNTGWEQVSLVSLSTTDHPGVEDIVQQVGRELSSGKISISLSSLRADNFSIRMAEATAGGRKTGLTFAIEAGTERLRSVINKNLTEEQLIETIRAAVAAGFNGIKLYFMVGLPTETDEDVAAIADLLNRIKGELRGTKGFRINVTLSPFSPKPMTPFQWEDQNNVETLKRKIRLVKHGLSSRAVTVKDTDPLISMLECRLGRGGRDMADLVLDAWKRGSRLDGWSEHFNPELWNAVFSERGIDLAAGGGGSEPGAQLAWSHLHFGVDERFLVAEREAAMRGEQTPNCHEKCSACGPYAPFCKAHSIAGSEETPAEPAPEPKPSSSSAMYGRRRKITGGRKVDEALPGMRIRIKYGKSGIARFTGHLDLVRLFDRALRRAGIPVAFSQGYHPHPKISFGYPLPLGFASEAEYADVSLTAPYPAFESALRCSLPDGFKVCDVRSVQDRAKSLASIVSRTEYFVAAPVDESLIKAVGDLLSRETVIVTRKTKKGDREVDIRPGIEDIILAGDGSGFTMILTLNSKHSPKPQEVFSALFGDCQPDNVTRMEQYAVSDGERIPLIDIRW